MKSLIIKGMKNIEGMKFHDIEGGFGEGKKAMLVKEIANIHERDLKVLNQNVSRNISRFKSGIDIVDLKGTEFEVILSDHGIYTQNAINRSSNIYLLSERGYAKLLKILEDDLAWDQYDKLVDEYFNMKAEFKNGQANLSGLSPQLQALINIELEQKKLDKKIEQVREENKAEIESIRNAVTLNSNGWRKETTEIINKVANKLGGFAEINILKKEIYKELNSRLGVDVNRRLLEKQKRMALEGVCKSKINKTNILDVIEEDKKLIDGYVNIIRQYSLKYGV